MKICPFLVAGRDLRPIRPAPAEFETAPAEFETAPAVVFVEEETDPRQERAPASAPTSAPTWELEELGEEVSGIECLGEPCRFFHAGGCRFDTLFAVHPSAGMRSAVASGAAAAPGAYEPSLGVESSPGADGVDAGAAVAIHGAGGGNGAQLGSVLQEVWSLQRESLKELIGGFRRLEGAQNAQQSTLAGQIEGLTLRVEEARSTAAGGDLAQLLEGRFASLERSVTNLESTLREALGNSGSSLQGELENTRRAVQAALESGLGRVQEGSQHLGRLGDELQGFLAELRRHLHAVAATAGTLETASQRTQALLEEERSLAADARERELRAEARRLNNAGVLSYHQGAYDTSVQQFRRALELDPSLAEAWNNLALAHTEMRRDGEALEAFKKALELDPSVGQVFNNLGYLYHRRGEHENALEMYERAIQRGHDTSAAWANLANALYEMRRADEAVAAWKRALEIDPANDKARTALERLGLGIPH
jgi:tetratricopeptide (TPR) repeat protein